MLWSREGLPLSGEEGENSREISGHGEQGRNDAAGRASECLGTIDVDDDGHGKFVNGR